MKKALNALMGIILVAFCTLIGLVLFSDKGFTAGVLWGAFCAVIGMLWGEYDLRKEI